MSDVKNAKKSLLIPVLFTVTTFIGSSLLFIVQPLMSKLLLPSFGGSEGVWTTAAFFFQLILLISYLIVHFTDRFGPKKQQFTLIPFAIMAILFLPIALPQDFVGIPDNIPPVAFLLYTLFVIVGFPFLLLAMNSTVLQKWYYWTGAKRSDDPYFLYGASNFGSFLGLFAYPFAIEPYLSLDTQQFMWTIGFIAFIALLSICGVITYVLNKETVRKDDVKSASSGIFVNGITWKRRMYWIALSFLPCSLYLGVTSYMTTDIAAFPLLWVIPLGIYLLSMSIAFARTSRSLMPKTTIVAAISAVVMLLITFTEANLIMVYTSLGIALVSLILISYIAHVHLAADRPEPKHLTEFFVITSIGGVLGGLFNSIIAPFIFTTTIEYPLVLATVPLLLIAVYGKEKMMKPVLSFTTVSILLTIMSTYVLSGGNTLTRERTFYGNYEVREIINEDGDREHLFFHGTTVHNTQNFGSEDEPTLYYHGDEAGIGQLYSIRDFQKVTVTGTGAGALAMYGEEGDYYNFIEIDQGIIDIAMNPEYFTYLHNTDATINNINGDGRVEIHNIENNQDLIVLDAFSSVSVPTHLLTVEAFEDYESKLADDGVIAINVSNRILDLYPVIAHVSDFMEMEAYIHYGNSSVWIAMSYDDTIFSDLNESSDKNDSGEWESLENYERIEWTDDYSSILDVLALD